MAHEANCGLQMILNDPMPSPHWLSFDQETRQSAISGVEKAISGRTPEELHEEWVRWKTDHGWRYGPQKDTYQKTHPCMVPYHELPDDEKIKDKLFTAIVQVLSAEE